MENTHCILSNIHTFKTALFYNKKNCMIRFPRIGYEFLRTYSKAKRNGKYPKHIFLLAGTMNVHCTCMSTLATCTVKVPVFFLTLFFSEIIIGFLFNALFLRNN